jgi:7-carboxy-7-deazaguanine synthase
MFNMQRPEGRVTEQSGQVLDVHSIFFTIQGEGPFCGTPAVFIRLAGCNLMCDMCDTDYTTNRYTAQPFDVARRAVEAPNYSECAAYDPSMDPSELTYSLWQGLVVITGGEPFRQPAALANLVRELISRGCYVQIETNGTLPPPRSEFYETDVSKRRGCYIVVSPKTATVHSAIAELACAYKYVLDADSVDADGLPKYVLRLPLGKQSRVARPNQEFTHVWKRPVYLQPMDVQNLKENERHVQACIKSCMKHGYILQLQVHKILKME